VTARLTFGPQVCGDLAAGASREWLVTDGLGGYAMGTVSGLRTRRYHGLLVVAGATPAVRRLALAALDPVLLLPSGAQVRLGTHEWADGTVGPQGHRLLERFDLVEGLPRWRWRVGEVVIERELAMVCGQPSVAVLHRLVAGPEPVGLALEVLCTWRDVHGERLATDGPLHTVPTADGVVVEDAYRIAGPGYEPGGEFYLGAYAREEAARGLRPVEDLWYAGRFVGDLRSGRPLEVAAWAGDLGTSPPPAGEVITAARGRARRIVAAAQPADDVDATLALAADAFVVRGASGPDVVAGYPWFGAWSRDTMTAYEGLFLDTGRVDEGRSLLLGYADTLSQGMLANTADTGRTEYNTVDATLWYLHAVERHVARTGDVDLAAELVGGLGAVVAAHLAGTRYGIRADADGLLTQGVDGLALTWMDARVDGRARTPRIGKPVEVNALWINGLAGLVTLRQRLGHDADELRTLRDRATRSFVTRFPAPQGWLYDVIDTPSGTDDASLRPNQLLAYSLPFGPLRGCHDGVAAAAGAMLLTPLGLRSLAPGDPAYLGAHRGGPADRDTAYHQGTVWPWLVGPYVDAAPRPRTEIDAILCGLEAHLAEWGLGSVSETADGDAPHAATGCPFQAWSVAEMIRVRRKIRLPVTSQKREPSPR